MGGRNGGGYAPAQKEPKKKKPALWKRKFNSALPPVDAFAGHRNLVRNVKYMDHLEKPELNVFTSAPAKEKKK